MIYSPKQLADIMLLTRQKNGWTQSELAKKSASSKQRSQILRITQIKPRFLPSLSLLKQWISH